MLSSLKKINAHCWGLHLKYPLPLLPTLAQAHSKLLPKSLESSSSLFFLHIRSWMFLKASLDTLIFKIFQFLIILYKINFKLLNIEIKFFKNNSLSFQSYLCFVPNTVNCTEREKQKQKQKNLLFQITSSVLLHCPSFSQQMTLNFFPLKSCPPKSSLKATSYQELFLISPAGRDYLLKALSNTFTTLRFFFCYYVPFQVFSFLVDK